MTKITKSQLRKLIQESVSMALQEQASSFDIRQKDIDAAKKLLSILLRGNYKKDSLKELIEFSEATMNGDSNAFLDENSLRDCWKILRSPNLRHHAGLLSSLAELVNVAEMHLNMNDPYHMDMMDY